MKFSLKEALEKEYIIKAVKAKEGLKGYLGFPKCLIGEKIRINLVENKVNKTLTQDLEVSQKKNCFIYHKANTEAHEDRKYEVFKWAMKKGYNVITEARFKDGKRADIVIDTRYNTFIVEVETNQKPENIAKKKANYSYSWLDYVAVIDPKKKWDEKDIL